MFEWKVENMALRGKGHIDYAGNGRMETRIYPCESFVSREDKIAFVDSLQGGKLSYILSLIEKFNVEKDNLPKKDSLWGGSEVKTVSLKTWINRNDKKYERPIIDNHFYYGRYRILNCERNIQNNHKGTYDYYEDLVDECFHRQLQECEKEEERYFLEHDEYSILKKKFLDNERKHGTTFGVSVVESSNGTVSVGDFDENREITIEELKELISKYEQLDALIEKLTVETHIVY